MNKIFFEKSLKDINKIIPKNSGVYVIADKNLSHFFSYFKEYKIIEINVSESNKTLSIVEEIAIKLLNFGADRDCFIIGFGGGVTTDIAGFISSIYKRGVRFGFIPTTLLSQVDAAIGGKNGVNLLAYKNILGTIKQPEWIFECSDVLLTLPLREFKAGIAEIIKTFILFDKEFYYRTIKTFSNPNLEINDTIEFIKKCSEYKCMIVKQDELEKGERRLLNLGHTFAHAIEKVVGDINCDKDKNNIMHGEAVSMGVVLAAKVAFILNLTDKEFVNNLIKDIKSVGLPALLTDMSCTKGIKISNIVDAIAKDKKISGELIHFIVPLKIGEVKDIKMLLTNLKSVANDLC